MIKKSIPWGVDRERVFLRWLSRSLGRFVLFFVSVPTPYRILLSIIVSEYCSEDTLTRTKYSNVYYCHRILLIIFCYLQRQWQKRLKSTFKRYILTGHLKLSVHASSLYLTAMRFRDLGEANQKGPLPLIRDNRAGSFTYRPLFLPFFFPSFLRSRIFTFLIFFLECIRGTYKRWPDPGQCTPCPAHSTTDEEGSIIIDQCKCFTGFEGDPSNDIPCTGIDLM